MQVCCDLEVDVNGEGVFMVDKVIVLLMLTIQSFLSVTCVIWSLLWEFNDIFTTVVCSLHLNFFVTRVNIIRQMFFLFLECWIFNPSCFHFRWHAFLRMSFQALVKLNEISNCMSYTKSFFITFWRKGRIMCFWNR